MKKLSHLLAIPLAALALSACTNDADDLTAGDTAIPLTYTVAPPPMFGIEPGTGTLPARSSIDLPTGKVTWDKGDKVYTLVSFLDKTDTEISSQKVILTRGDTDWIPDRSIVWPIAAAGAQIFATYIGTAKPEETIINQPVYQSTLVIDAGKPVEMAFDTSPTACLALSGLQPDDEVTLTGNRWHTWTLSDTYMLLLMVSMPTGTTFTADANGQVDIFAYILANSNLATITITRGGTAIATNLDLQLPGKDAGGTSIEYRGQLIPITINTGRPGGVDPGTGM